MKIALMTEAEKQLVAAVEVAVELLNLRALQIQMHPHGNRKARPWSDAARDLREALAAVRSAE